MHTQAAVVRTCSGSFKFETVEIDEPRSYEILVRIKACGICHTDIAVRDGLLAPHFPRVLGHEGAGIVEKVGKKVTSLSPGDKVLLSFCSCGKCANCRKDHPAHCIKFDALNFGWTRLDGSSTLWDANGFPLGGNFFGQSSFAYHSLTHERNAIAVDVTEEELALFAPLGCGIQAGAGTVLHELQIQEGEPVIVFGAGSVGLAAVMAAHLVKARPIIAVDTVSSRLKMAEELGAHAVINSQKENLATRIKQIVDGADYIVETTGKSLIINQAISFLRSRGKISLLAVSDGKISARLKPQQMLIDSIAGDSNPQTFLPFLISCYKKGLFPFDKLISQYPARAINQAISDSLKGTTIKPVLCFD